MLRRVSKRWRTAALLSAALLCLGAAGHMQLKAMLAQILLKQSWQVAQLTGETRPPWPGFDGAARWHLTLPEGQGLYVMDSASGQALAFGPGHIRETPVPGAPGLSVLAAHKNTHFEPLKDLKPGDIIEIRGLDGRRLQFSVTTSKVIDTRFENLALVDSGPPQLALSTCYPFDAVSFGGPLRYVVFAELVEASEIS